MDFWTLYVRLFRIGSHSAVLHPWERELHLSRFESGSNVQVELSAQGQSDRTCWSVRMINNHDHSLSCSLMLPAVKCSPGMSAIKKPGCSGWELLRCYILIRDASGLECNFWNTDVAKWPYLLTEMVHYRVLLCPTVLPKVGHYYEVQDGEEM